MKLKVEKVVFGGDGLGRLPDGQVVFVSGVVPGELVKVKILKSLKDYALAELEDVLEPSPHRVEPRCVYYGTCGGCQLQHISYEFQLRIKEEILKESLRRHGGISEEWVEGVVASDDAFHYRNRLRFHVEPGTGRAAFVKRKSHELIPVKRCLLGHELLNQALQFLEDSPSWKRLQSFSKRIRLELSPAEDEVCLLFWTTVEPEERDLLELVSEVPPLKNAFFWTKGPKPRGPFPKDSPYGGRRLFPVPEEFFPEVKAPTYFVRPGVFTQANWTVNLKIMEVLRAELEDEAPDRVLDLHSGMGNFLLPLSEFFETALGVDTDPGAISDARYTAERLGLSQKVEFHRKSATEALIETWKAAETYPLVILDPPRGGCRELMRYLPEVARNRIVYISCDPPTLARDLRLLLEAGYELERIVGFDMFPHTYHIEAVAFLKKRS